MPTYKPVGVDADSKFPPRVQAQLESTFNRVWNVFTEAQIAPTIAAIQMTGGGSIRIPEWVTLNTAQSHVFPNEVRNVFVDGKWIAANGTTPISRRGAYAGTGQFASITANVAAGSRQLTVNSVAALAVDDWIFVASNDTIRSSTDKRGYMRQIVDIVGTTVYLDEGIPRGLTSAQNARAYKINMAAKFTLGGTGEICYADQEGSTPMLLFRWVHDLTIESTLKLHTGGGPCVALQHVVGGQILARIDRFRNDVPGGHIGYGVMAGGACRDISIGGRISRCRHAFTTVAGPANDDGTAIVAYAGEPENIIAEPITYRCSDKALDTHVPGWGITLRLRDVGSGGGVHVRSDNTTVEGSGDCLTGPLVQIDNEGGAFEVEPIIRHINGTNITVPAGSGVISLSANASFLSLPKVKGFSGGGSLWKVDAGVRVKMHPEVTYAEKTVQQTVTNTTTLVDVTELVLPVEAGGEYTLDAYIIGSSGTAGDLKFAWTAPAGTDMHWTPNGPNLTASSTSAQVTRQDIAAPETEGSVGGTGAAVNMVSLIRGRLIAGGDGNLQLQFAQATLDAASNTTIRAGSWIKLERRR